MTVSIQPRSAGPFAGTGAIVALPFGFKVFQASDLRVYRIETDGTQTELVLSVDYTVTLNADQNASPGGTVTPLAAVAIGTSWGIVSDVSAIQPLSLTNTGGFYPKAIEDQLDRVIILLQQMGFVGIGQYLRVPESVGVPALPRAAARANSLLSFDSDGNPITVAPVSGSATDVITQLASTADASKGAGMVAFLSSLAYPSGSVGAALKAAASQFLTVASFGAVGTADDTTVFQTAMNTAASNGQVLLVGAATYTLNPVSVPSGLTMFIAPKALLKAKASYATLDCLLNIVNVSNVTIYGNKATVQMLKSEYTTGEWRHCVNILGATDVSIYDLHAIDSGGDGFYVGRSGGAGTHSKRIALENCHANNNRRQGLSIVSVEGLKVSGCMFEGTTGTAPQYGIDIEPNDSLDVLSGIAIRGVKTKNNTGGGLLIALQNFAATADVDCGIHISGIVSDGDGQTTANAGSAALRFSGSGGGAWAHKVRGTIKVDGVEILHPVASAARCDYWDASGAPLIQIQDVTVINPGSGSPANSEDKCGLVIWAYDLGGANFGNIEVQRMRIYDNRGTPGTYSPVYIYKSGGLSGVGQAKNVHLTDVMGIGFTPTSGRGHVLTITDVDTSSFEYTDEQTVNNISNSADVTRGYAGYTITCTASGVVTLPKASTNRGLSYRFLNLNEGQNLQVRPTTGDILDYCDTNANTDLVLSRYGGYVELLATDNNFYRAPNITDVAKRPALCPEMTGPRLEVWVTGKPTSGFWGLGTIAKMYNPTRGNPTQWHRLTTGSGNVLGTDWAAGPNLP